MAAYVASYGARVLRYVSLLKLESRGAESYCKPFIPGMFKRHRNLLGKREIRYPCSNRLLIARCI